MNTSGESQRPSPSVSPAKNRGCIIWLTGFSGAGKSTIATELHRELLSQGQLAYMLDGDIMRRGLCSDLGFSPHDRKENIRRVGEVAALFADAGVVAISAFISPYRVDRDRVRSLVAPGQFVEVHVSTPIEVCEQRDTKGLYAKARAHKIEDFTGISAPYEPPLNPEVVVDTSQLTVAQTVARVLQYVLGKS